MNIFKRLRSLNGESQGLVYTVQDLEIGYIDYRRHVLASVDELGSLVTKLGMPSFKRGFHDGLSPVETVGKVKFTYLHTIDSWVGGEFIPKIKNHCDQHAATRLSEWCHRPPVEPLSLSGIRLAEFHREASKVCGRRVIDALHFMLCDFRSPFDRKASLDGGATVAEITEWYIGGKRIVSRNMTRIDNALGCLITLISQS